MFLVIRVPIIALPAAQAFQLREKKGYLCAIHALQDITPQIMEVRIVKFVILEHIV